MAQKAAGGESQANSSPSVPPSPSSKLPAKTPTGSSILPRMSDPNPPPSKAPSPQPTNTGEAAASALPDNHLPAPYGTRSRNRGGAARPNYAETTDFEEDSEVAPEKRHDTPGTMKKTTRQSANPSLAGASQSAQATSKSAPRKSLPSSADDSRASTLQMATAKTQCGASSTRATSPPAPPTTKVMGTAAPQSKKRKATTQTNGAAQPHQLAAASTVANASKKAKPASSSAAPAAASSHAAATGSAQGSVDTRNNSPQRGIGYAETNMMTFENCGAKTNAAKQLIADDGTILSINDHVYLICEPPGEPYYLCRIMEWQHDGNDASRTVHAIKVNWYYRTKDVVRSKVHDMRMLFATMHSDTCPLTSLRGKVTIRHKTEILDLAEYKRTPDSFWFEKLYDRYLSRTFEVVPTALIINVPPRIKKVLDERWKYVLVEQGRGKELTSAVKLCKRCQAFCANPESVDCAVCKNTYHMNCVKPPLLKKPSRGFAWSCAACSRAQERKLEARNTPNVLEGGRGNADAEEEDLIDEDEEDHHLADGTDTGRTSPDQEEATHAPPTEEQLYNASLWPFRYLGIHCRLEDVFDYDDRISPRASTRLGPRFQANVLPWPGRPVVYEKPMDVKKSHRKDGKLSKELQLQVDKEKLRRENRPKWVQDEPPGYTERGGDETVDVLYLPPESPPDLRSTRFPYETMRSFRDKVRALAKPLGLANYATSPKETAMMPDYATNLLDMAMVKMHACKYDAEKALEEIKKVDKADLKEPELTPAEQKKFEEGVVKYGSDLYGVEKHVKTLSHRVLVRWYYKWKKTEKGKLIWGLHRSRKGKKENRQPQEEANTFADDVAHDHDDSAFDEEKAARKRKTFVCKFCNTTKSRQWRRLPASAITTEKGKNMFKDKNGQAVQALCRRCAELWRRYGIRYEDKDEVAKKVSQTGRSGKRKVDEDMLQEMAMCDEMMTNTHYPSPETAVAAPAASTQGGQEPPRKKLKGAQPEKEAGPATVQAKKKDKAPEKDKEEKKAVEKEPEKPAPPPEPPLPKPRIMPCAICMRKESRGEQHMSCQGCRMTVHRSCYGIIDNRVAGKWFCDMCVNDKSSRPQLSVDYKCVLCPVERKTHDFIEPPKVSHKKKTDKDRERERQEKQLADKAEKLYRQKQIDMGRPENPWEPLKRTADNNWVHVTCAVWTPEVKFGNARALGPCEGIPSIPRARYAETCRFCKKSGVGACVSCQTCKAPMHVECAHERGHLLGFDMAPVKGSRRDQANVVSINGDSGAMTAAVWCKDHVPPKHAFHHMNETVDDSGLTAMQLYVQKYKQADLTLTGCARKANQIVAAKMSVASSVANAVAPSHSHAGPVTRRACETPREETRNGNELARLPGRVCLTCGANASCKWHAIGEGQERELTNGHHGLLGSEAKKFVAQRSAQCHKCKKQGRRPHAQHPPKDATPAPTETTPMVTQVTQAVQLLATPPPTNAAPGARRSPTMERPRANVSPPAVQPPPKAPPVAQRAPSMYSSHAHPPFQPASYSGDWHHRPPASHATPPPPRREMRVNGAPSSPRVVNALSPTNHLRPPPVPYMNGTVAPPPPPPSRRSPPPLPRHAHYTSPVTPHHVDLRHSPREAYDRDHHLSPRTVPQAPPVQPPPSVGPRWPLPSSHSTNVNSVSHAANPGGLQERYDASVFADSLPPLGLPAWASWCQNAPCSRSQPVPQTPPAPAPESAPAPAPAPEDAPAPDAAPAPAPRSSNPMSVGNLLGS